MGFTVDSLMYEYQLHHLAYWLGMMGMCLFASEMIGDDGPLTYLQSYISRFFVSN